MSSKSFIFYVVFVGSLGGLLFGFDTAVISGAEKAIQAFYVLSNTMLGFTIAVALFGTVVGALFCARPVDRYGRKPILIVIALLYLISALGCAAAHNWYSFIIMRFLGGLAVGASSVAGPLYIAEISPSQWRGRFVAFFQFNIVLGIVLAYFSNYYISSLGIADDWRIMLGVMAVPALLFAVLLFTIPESPRWLMKQGSDKKASEVFQRIGEQNVEHQMHEIRESLRDSVKGVSERLFHRKYIRPILYAFLIATFNQLSGINAILYYAPRIFETAGIMRDSALMQSILIGLTNLTFTMIAMVIIDKVGRRRLLLFGSVGMVISLAMVAVGYYTGVTAKYYMLICLVGFIAFFAMSLGATIWVLISEVFPTSVRSKGQVFGSMTHWLWSAILSWIFPVIVSSGGPMGGTYIFGFFAVAMALNFFFAWKILPETKNKSLEELQKTLTE